MIGDVWAALKSSQGLGPGIVERRVMPEAPVDVFAAVRKPSNTPMLIVQASTESLPRDFVVPDAQGFSVSLSPTIPGPRGRIAIQLELLDEAGESVFLALVDDLLRHLESVRAEQAAMRELSQAIKRWTAFFRDQGACGLSRERQQGLFGELFFLRERLSTAASMGLAVSAWVGPTGSNQDFEHSGRAFEVKTTAKNPLIAIRISNLRQLDIRCVESLRLIVLEVERHENADNTLPQAVEATRALVLQQAPDQAFRFATCLVEYGYLDQQAHLYSHTGYGVRAVRAYAVGNGFPVLIEEDMPNGVGNVTYSIDMSAISEYEVAPDRFQTEMEGWFGDLG
jgi:hypothetical protein